MEVWSYYSHWKLFDGFFMKSSLWPALGGTVWCHFCQGHQADLIPLWSRFSGPDTLGLLYSKAGNITLDSGLSNILHSLLEHFASLQAWHLLFLLDLSLGMVFFNGEMDSSSIRGRCCPSGKTLTLGEEELSLRPVILMILVRGSVCLIWGSYVIFWLISGLSLSM